MRVTATCITAGSREDIRALCALAHRAVIDYGCGEATSADLVADACGHLTMVEAAPNVRAALTVRYAGQPKIAVIAAEQAAALPKASFDLVVMHSVAQYLTQAELDRLLASSAGCSSRTALFILGDIVPPHFAAPAAALSLLRFAAANGFFWAAAFAARADLRVGLSAPEEDGGTVALHRSRDARASAPGRVSRPSAPARNIGHNQWRMTFLCRVPT